MFRIVVILVVGLLAVAGANGYAADFEVVLLGTGIPLPNPERMGAATLIVAGDTTVLVDTGRGAMGRLATAGFQDVDLVLYTHFHSDHISGLADIMVNRSIAGVDVALDVRGPVGTAAVVEGLLAGFSEDTKYRVAHHGEHWPVNGKKANVTEAGAGVVFEEDGLRVTMFEVDHRPVAPAVGYRFDYGGKSVVVSGDTKKVAAMVSMAKGVDLLIHEAIDAQTLNQARRLLSRQDPRRAAMLDDMMRHHTTTIEVAEIARDAGVKKLVLTHLVPSIPPVEAREAHFVRGMDAIFSGPIIVARDGMRVTP